MPAAHTSRIGARSNGLPRHTTAHHPNGCRLARTAGERSVGPVPAVVANGTPSEFHTPCSLEAFLRQLGLPPRSVVVELNGEAVSPSEFESRLLSEGDRLEIVRIVAGG